jgi:molybdopterin molybdotransferase
MISYQQAKDRLIEQMPDYGAERCCWKNAVGRLLREPVWVDRPLPPYDRVMMDGYAMRASDLAVDSLFRVKGVAWAGKAASALSDEPFSCMEVMTGAALPIGADVVIPVEKTERWGDGIIRISDKAMREVGTFIHRAGSDARAGDIALEVGRKIGSREMGVIASCGATSLSVARLPKIAIQATGDELVAVEQMPMDHQIRQSNGHALLAGLTAVGFAAEVLPTLADDASADEIQQKWQGYDLVIVTGAVSMGKKDFVPRAMQDLGYDCLFHGVAQRPGKPLGVWKKSDQMIIALPGNPVSALVGLHAMVLPALRKAIGMNDAVPRMVSLQGKISTPPGLTLHLPVCWVGNEQVGAAPAGNSGDFMGLLRSDGWITLPADACSKQQYEFHEWI